MSCSLGCVSLQQWLVNGGHTADLWQNCTSGSVFHCLTSSTNGECSQQAGVLLPLTFILLLDLGNQGGFGFAGCL